MAKVLVTGATGTTGSGLVPALCRAGVEVRALVREAAKAQTLKDAGATLVVGDLDDPGSIEAAIDGVDKIYLLTWNGPTQAQQVDNVLAAAKRSGAPHIVRHSAWGSPKSRIITQIDRAEAAVKASGLPWTLLKPTFFMQNTMMGAGTIASDGMMYWDLGDGKIGMIDARDIVDAALAVLTGSGHEGKSYILTGPAAISMHDAARELSTVLGKNVTYVNVPHDAALASMVGMGFPEWIALGYTELDEGFSEGFAGSVTNNVEALTGHPARSFATFAGDFAQVFGGAPALAPSGR